MHASLTPSDSVRYGWNMPASLSDVSPAEIATETCMSSSPPSGATTRAPTSTWSVRRRTSLMKPRVSRAASARGIALSGHTDTSTATPASAASRSLMPTPATCGSVKTTHGSGSYATARMQHASSARALAAASAPSYAAVYTNILPARTSPAAKTPGSVVCKCASTTTAPRESSATPAAAAPRPSVFARRPVATTISANSSWRRAPRSTPLPACGSPTVTSTTTAPPAARRATPCVVTPVCTVMPSAASHSRTASLTSASSVGSSRAERCSTVTRAPRRDRSCASSRAT
mmetsp:Transcript_23384/g.81484  ORF Transcript_23384/g.81484 Transcript_23384/m.81484 type:complete len:289 (-) Transcript_23384:155-1021(-)